MHNFLHVGGMSLPADEKIIKKIYELVGEGVHQVRSKSENSQLSLSIAVNICKLSDFSKLQPWQTVTDIF